MNYKMSEFQGVDPGHIEKLREVSIETTDDMMRAWGDQPNRAALVEKTGVDLDTFTRFASMARLARVKNVGPRFVGVLMAAGIDGPKSLFENTPEALVKRLGEVAAEKHITSPIPTSEEISTWYTEKAAPVAP